MLRRAHGAALHRRFALFDNAIRCLFHHLLEEHAQMRVPPVISGRNVFHPIGVRGKLVTFLKLSRADSSGS
jgi:hypothetical protein